MARKPPAPKLTVVAPAPAPEHPQPPRELDATGRALWDAVVRDYEFADPGSTEVLYQACAAVERAERCRRIIDEDGEVVKTRTGPRSHPLLRDEVANRALAARLIGRLGMDLEPLRTGPGRPPGARFS
jgi:hypothetical protein